MTATRQPTTASIASEPAISARRFGRRGLLAHAGGAALAAASWPALVSHAFAQSPTPAEASLAGVSAAYRAARRGGRPLLILVIPQDDGARWDRGSAFGAFLNHASDEAITALGLCEVTCAPMSAVRQLMPQAPPGEPLMVLVDPRTVPAAASALDAALPAEPVPDWSSEDASNAYYAALDARVDAMIAIVTRLVIDAVGPLLAVLTPPVQAEARARAIDLYRTHRVPGSHWASSAGCGVSIEGVEDLAIVGCGMGHTPERARRFLHFFAIER